MGWGRGGAGTGHCSVKGWAFPGSACTTPAPQEAGCTPAKMEAVRPRRRGACGAVPAGTPVGSGALESGGPCAGSWGVLWVAGSPLQMCGQGLAQPSSSHLPRHPLYKPLPSSLPFFPFLPSPPSLPPFPFPPLVLIIEHLLCVRDRAVSALDQSGSSCSLVFPGREFHSRCHD